MAGPSRHRVDIPMGWSDHTLAVTVVPALAVACGATVIEKHLRWRRQHETSMGGIVLDRTNFSDGETVRQVSRNSRGRAGKTRWHRRVP